MMTLRRFRGLADSYGADLQRWPEDLRAQALTLLDASAEARAIITGARELDEAIAAARAAHDARLWGTESPDAALHRLRASISTRIRRAPSARASLIEGIDSRPARHLPRRAEWFGLATAAGLAVLAGLALGFLYSPSSSPPQDHLTALLQPVPLQLLTD
jgi:hypothetical protein